MVRERNRALRSLMSLLICMVLILCLCPAEALAVTQADIDAAEARRDALTEQRKAAQAVVDGLEEEQASVLERKLAMDERNQFTLEQLEIVGEQIDLYDQMIQEKAAEVEEARRLEQEQLERYRTRVRAMEEQGNYNILALILQSDNLGDLLTTIDDVGEIMESDKQLEKEYIAAREHAEQVQAEYEAYKAELEEKQEGLREEQKQLEAELEEANNLLLDLEQQLEENGDLLAELQAQEDRLDAELDALIAQREEERRQQQVVSSGNASSGYTGGTVTGSGSYIWPVSCTYITSCVGYRYHPVSGIWKYHSGMDIGSSHGDTVWATDGGTVCCAGVKGGYGNCVMIDHGNGYYSLYGHLSAIAVSLNQTVSKGDTIGYVGSTGVSTGPHLHFEFRDSSGGSIDYYGLGWFSGLTFAPDSGG